MAGVAAKTRAYGCATTPTRREPGERPDKQPPGGWQWNRFDAAHQDHEVLEVIVAAHEIFVSKDGIANIELRTLRAAR